MISKSIICQTRENTSENRMEKLERCFDFKGYLQLINLDCWLHSTIRVNMTRYIVFHNLEISALRTQLSPLLP
ncbi:hypothetical protein AB3S75_020189 [Citrus x aurantiifolia]